MFSNKPVQKFTPTLSNKKRVRIVQTEGDQHLMVTKSQFPNRASIHQENPQRCINPYAKKSLKDPKIQRKILKTNNQKGQNFFFKTEPDELVEKSENQEFSISSSKYQIDGVAGKGTFGIVYIGHVRGSGEKIAIKKVLQDKRYKNRELQILQFLKNGQVLQMKDFYINYEGEQKYLNIVMFYYPYNLYQVIKKKQFTPTFVKIIFYQILKGLNYLAAFSIAHRDIKPQNILVDFNTSKAVICDFGSAKVLVQSQPNLSYICSRCYRAPELIFGAGDYSCQIDMWSVGCVLVEMINGNPPFLGQSQIDQLVQIVKVLGTPSKENIFQMNKNYDMRQYAKFPIVNASQWKNLLHTKDTLLIDLVSKILQYSPKRRLTAAGAIMHPYFDELRKEENFKQLSSKHRSYFSLFKFSKQQLSMFKDPNSVVPDWLENKKVLEFSHLKFGIKKSVHRRS